MNATKTNDEDIEVDMNIPVFDESVPEGTTELFRLLSKTLMRWTAGRNEHTGRETIEAMLAAQALLLGKTMYEAELNAGSGMLPEIAEDLLDRQFARALRFYTALRHRVTGTGEA